MKEQPRDWRDERIAELEAEIEQLRLALREVLARNKELERQLGLNSQNSSKPPSTDSDKDREKRPRGRRSGRRPGGQPGHEGHHRELLPEDEVDNFESHFPTACDDCGCELSPEDASGGPLRHQVFDIVDKPVECTEHQVFTCQCPACGETSRGQLPADIASSGWGPRLTALVATLSAICRDSRRQCDWFVTEVLGAPSSVGTVQRHLEEVSAGLEPGFEQIRFAMAEVTTGIGLDETGWRLGNLPYWVWVAESEEMALYLVRRRRTKEMAQELVGEPADRVFVTDRYGAYGFLEPSHHQICHAHLLREFTAMAARDGPLGAIGTKLCALSREMQLQWSRVKSGQRSRADFVEWVNREVQPSWKRLLKAAKSAPPKEPAVVRWLLKKKHRELAWTFLKFDGLEPTNNGAERALRGPVIQRKLSWGSKSEAGLRLMERLWTAAETCRRQGRSVLEYITNAVNAFRNDCPAPILRPA
jgi:transposase